MIKSIGNSLKQARVEKNLTLDEISKALHIRIKYLEALEANDFDLLPSRVQVRGFLRLYADFLNIDNIDDGNQPDPAVVEHTNSITLPDLSLQNNKSTALSPNNDIEEPVQTEDEYAECADIAEEPDNPDTSATPSSQDIFQLIGKTLLSRREALGITLEEVERHTHLKSHYLKSLESGDFNNLPSPVQGKGMLSNYARFLDLDNEQILLLFADALQTKRQELAYITYPNGQTPSSSKKRAPTKPSTLQRFLTPDLLIGSSILIIIFVFSLWTISTINTQRETSLKNTPPPISDVLSNQPVLDSTTPPIDQLTPTPVVVQQNPGITINNPENDVPLEEAIPSER